MCSVAINREFDFRLLDHDLVAFHGGTGETYKLSGLAVVVVDELLRHSEGSTVGSLLLSLGEQEYEVTAIRVEKALELLRDARMVTDLHV